MKDMFVIVDNEDTRAVLVEAEDKEEAIETYIRWLDIDEDEFSDEDREALEVQPVVLQNFVNGVMEVASW